MRGAPLAGGLAFLAAIAAALFLTFGVSYSSTSCTLTAQDATGLGTCVSDSRTLVEENGIWVLFLLGIPILLSGIVFVSVLPAVYWDKYAGRTAAVGLFLFCIVLIVSLGLLFVPSLLLAIIALFLDRKRVASTQ